MKKLTSIVLALALALTVVAPVAASAQSAGYTFSTNLTIGSRGSDVVALQSFLVAKGVLTMPAGVAMGYFGGLTKSALAAYQSMKGITPAAGYFGPITRAAVMAEGAVSTGTPGCSAGNMYNSITGQPCGGPAPVVPGCPAGALYNSMTGAVCTATAPTGPVNTGVEGTLDIRQATAPTNDANIQTQNDVPVYGIEFKARLADSVIQTLDLQVSSTLSSSAENPGSFINTIKVWDGSTLLATVPVNTSTFTKDSSSVYYIRLSGLNFLVPKDATKVLTVSFSVNATDSTVGRVVVISGYGTNSVRSVSGNGVNSFSNVSGITRTHTFKRPGTSTLTLSGGTPVLRSTNNRVNTSNSVIVPVLNFSVKSETGTSRVTSVTATTTLYSGFTIANDATYYLYDGSTLLDSRTGATSVTFANLTIDVPADTTKVLTVKIGFAATSSSVTTPYVSTTTVSSVVYEKPNGGSETVSTAVNGVGQYVYTAAPLIALASTPTIAVNNAAISSATSTMTASFPLTVTPQGGEWDYSVAAAVIKFTKSNNSAVATTTVATVAHNPSNTNIPQNTPGSVTLSGTTAGTRDLTNGTYVASVESITWKVGSITVTQTYGLTDFITPPSTSSLII